MDTSETHLGEQDALMSSTARPSESRRRSSTASSNSFLEPPHIHGTGTSRHRAPDVSPRFSQPSLFDNQFPSPSARDVPDDTSASEGYTIRSRSPALFIARVDGTTRAVAEQDFGNGHPSASDSDQSEGLTDFDFKSIKTIDDGGFGAWGAHHSAASDAEREQYDAEPASSLAEVQIGVPNSSPDNGPAELAGAGDTTTSASEGSGILQGVGSSFSQPPQTPPAATTQELESYLEHESVESVGDDIRYAKELSAYNKAEFFPLDKLRRIINRATVQTLLRTAIPHATAPALDYYAEEICGLQLHGTGRRKIFAILVLINKVEYIKDIIEMNLDDLHLPLEFEWDRRIHKYVVYKKGDASPRDALSWCMNWTHNDMELFKSNQSLMLASFLNLPLDDIYFYKLADHFVLPFLEYEPKENSGYGRVLKVKIHRAHHNFRQSKDFPDHNPYFAVKALHSNRTEDFRKEVEVLKKFSGANKRHDHLIRLLLAYRHGDSYFLLFNWADGNLKQFWEFYPNPPIISKNSRWIIEQCFGIADGLRKIHRVTSDSWPTGNSATAGGQARLGVDDAKDWGRHGDIKPENILWFKNLHRLVISDFGLSRYHTAHSKSHDPHEKLQGFSPTYRSPECDLRQNISQRYDIWPMGCMFLEFLSWYILGFEATHKLFAEERIADDVNLISIIREDKFFNIITDLQSRAELKDSVKRRILVLHAHEKCPDFVHNFLDLIEKHLLVPESAGRWECAPICRELMRIRYLCYQSDDYCAKGNPRLVTDEEQVHSASSAVLHGSYVFIPRVGHEVHSQGGKAQGSGQDFTGDGQDAPQPPSFSQQASGTSTVRPRQSSLSGDREQIEDAITRFDTSAHLLDREEDDDFYPPALSSIQCHPPLLETHPRRDASGEAARALPSLRPADTTLTSQDSQEAGATYSADTTPPSTSHSSTAALVSSMELGRSNHSAMSKEQIDVSHLRGEDPPSAKTASTATETGHDTSSEDPAGRDTEDNNRGQNPDPQCPRSASDADLSTPVASDDRDSDMQTLGMLVLFVSVLIGAIALTLKRQGGFGRS